MKAVMVITSQPAGRKRHRPLTRRGRLDLSRVTSSSFFGRSFYARPATIVCNSAASASGALTCGEWLASISK